ncbi:hypothetical protein GC207_07590 [bacterium]|nr:hypothetical protein [bacterium]
MHSWRIAPTTVFLAATIVIHLTGCRTGGFSTVHELPAPTAEVAATMGLATSDIAGARRLYVAKCARCHKFYNPLQYDDGEWNRWMRKMSRKAHLSTNEDLLLTRYFDALRKSSNSSVESQKDVPRISN